MIELISKSDERADRRKVENLTIWCNDNLFLNVNKKGNCWLQKKKSDKITFLYPSLDHVLKLLSFIDFLAYTSQVPSHGLSTPIASSRKHSGD